MGIYRTTVELTGPGIVGTGVNTFHYRTTEDTLNPVAQATLGAFTQNLQSFYLAMGQYIASPTTISSAGDWAGVGPSQGEFTSVAGWSSSLTNNNGPLPLATALCISWATAVRTRSGRGRTFISPVDIVALQDNGTPTEASRAALVGAADGLISSSDEPADGAFCIWSPTDQVARDVVSASVSNEFAVLRSRRD